VLGGLACWCGFVSDPLPARLCANLNAGAMRCAGDIGSARPLDPQVDAGLCVGAHEATSAEVGAG
jgi:hypothetical protein